MQASSPKRATAPIAVLLLLVLAGQIPVAQAEPPPFIDCGQVITKSTVLVRDIGPCPEDGLIIGADNITLSLNGHRIFGTADTGAFAGIRLRRVNGVTVTGKNAEGRSPAGTAPMGSVDNFDAGVVIGGGSNNTVRDLDIHDNVGPEDFSADLGSGIAVFSSKDNLLSDNVVRRNGLFEGIGVFGRASTGNRIERNIIEDNHATITRTFDDGTPSFEQPLTQGINLGLGLEGSHNNIIIGNEIRRSGLNGIVACSHFGVPCQTTGNVIKGNIIEDNAARDQSIADGIRIVSFFPRQTAQKFVTNNVVEDNRVTGNGANGIFVGNDGNRIVNNFAVGNNPRNSGGRFDLRDSGRPSVGDPPKCGNNIWLGNTYGTAFPSCTRVGGQQVGSQDPGPADDETLPGEDMGRRAEAARQALLGRRSHA